MNRLIPLCTVLALGLTAAAVADHQRASDDVPPEALSVPAAAPSVAGPESPGPLLSASAVLARIEEFVAAPLRERREQAGGFSRVWRPRPAYSVRVEAGGGEDVTRFRIYAERNPLSRLRREAIVATGLVDRRSGGIRLAPGSAREPAPEAFLPVERALERLALRR